MTETTPAPQGEDDPFAGTFIERDRWGRPKIVPADGGKATPYTRVSTFAKALDDAGGLVNWKARQVALGIGRHEDLAAVAAGCTYGDRTLDDIIESAVQRVTDAAAYGTAVHAFTDPDPSPYVPDRMRGDVDAYFATMTDLGVEQVDAERFVVCDELQTAGTYDGRYRIPFAFLEAAHAAGHTYIDLDDRRELVLGDKKTGKIRELAVAVQTAAYAHSEAYEANVDGTTSREPLGVRQDVALLIHIPNGEARCDIHLIDIEAGWAAAHVAVTVRALRKDKSIVKPIPVLGVVEAPGVPPSDPTCLAVNTDDAARVCCRKPRHHGNHTDDGGRHWVRVKGEKKSPTLEAVPDPPEVEPVTAEVSMQADYEADLAAGEDAAPDGQPYTNAELDAIVATERPGLAAQAAVEVVPVAERIAHAETVDALVDLYAETGAAWTDDDKALASARRSLLLGGLATTVVTA